MQDRTALSEKLMQSSKKRQLSCPLWVPIGALNHVEVACDWGCLLWFSQQETALAHLGFYMRNDSENWVQNRCHSTWSTCVDFRTFEGK